MTNYLCYWSINDGATSGKFFEKNLKTAKKDLKEIAKDNCPRGNKYFYSIYDLEYSNNIAIFERIGIKKND